MRTFFFSVLHYFLTPFGILLMGVLDASVVFFLPLGIDFVLIILAARKPELFWLYALLASAGSVAGAAGTFWIGRQVGEHGLARLVSPKLLRHVKARVSAGAAMSTAGLAIIPPPFPFTPFVLTSGALGMNPWTFLGTLAGARLVRFGIEAGLAARYGRRWLTRWMRTPTFGMIVASFIAVAVIGTVVSAIVLMKGARERG